MVRWQTPTYCKDSVKSISKQFQLHPALARCLLKRIGGDDLNDWNEHEVRQYLGESRFSPPDPFLLGGMDIAVKRIQLALKNNEKIVIFGDYDADGVTATSILYLALEKLGGQVEYYIPDRFGEGVGLTEARLDWLVRHLSASLIITVDTGCRCVSEIDYASKIGVDVIVTDHHLPGEALPRALAVINPKIPGSSYPYPDLCGAGVAYKLVEALSSEFPGQLELGMYQKIAAIGTIADMVPLTGENRWLVKKGLREMDREPRGPLRLLLKKLGIRNRVFSQDVSYKIAPRINAPGRLGDPDTAMAFLLGKGSHQDASRLVDIIDGMNHIRQMLERDLEHRLDLQVKSISNGTLPPFIMLAGKNWHRGILGITACKMLRKYDRPVCVLSYDAEVANGSIRGVPGVNLIETLAEIDSLFTSYGGHAEAAGVSLDVTNLPQFKQRMNELLASKVSLDQEPEIHRVDSELDWCEVQTGFFKQLMKLEPFGSGNHTPQFLTRNLILETEIQRHGPWLSFEASDGVSRHKCSFYHPDDLSEELEKYDSIDLIYSIIPYRDDFQIQVSHMQSA